MLQMYAMPVFDMIEDACRRKRIKSRLFTRVFMRSLFVVFTAFIGITLPFFGGEHLHCSVCAFPAEIHLCCTTNLRQRLLLHNLLLLGFKLGQVACSCSLFFCLWLDGADFVYRFTVG